jgi:signal transduction histidine kinase
MEEVRLYDLLKECVDHAEENLKGHPIRIVSQFDPIKNESMKLDPLQIKEVFHNILADAADALAHRKDGQIKVSVLRHGSQGEISIIFEDNGIGISESDLKRIHEPFFTTKSKGTGLGLTVCTQIIQNHGGRIEVTSQIGQGSIFTVILPVGEGIVG